MRLIVYIFLAAMFSVPAHASQTMAKFIFEDAEKALARQDFNAAISKLNEAEQALGKTNMPILSLRINARHELLKQGPFYLAMHDLLKADMDDFLENYGSNPKYENEARQVYRLSQELKSMGEKDAALLDSQRKAATNGDVRSIEAMINRYSDGVGVYKDDKQVAYWRSALVAAQVKAEHEAAQAGSIDAMRSLSRRYAEGDGVEKNDGHSIAWLRKARELEDIDAKRRRQLAHARESELLQEEIDGIVYFKETRGTLADLIRGSDSDPAWLKASLSPFAIAFSPALLVITPYVPSSELTDFPSQVTKRNSLKRKLASRATAWARPDSMIGKSYVIYHDSP